jgi:hypothetical protein
MHQNPITVDTTPRASKVNISDKQKRMISTGMGFTKAFEFVGADSIQSRPTALRTRGMSGWRFPGRINGLGSRARAFKKQ